MIHASFTTVNDNDMLPAFVLGYEGAVRVPDIAPPWLHVIRHQYDGLRCSHRDLTGCVLRLSANQAEGTGKLWLFTRALVELGEMWPSETVYEAREVRDLVSEIATAVCKPHGGDMIAGEIASFDQIMTEHLAFPGLTPPVVERGNEALISFRESNPLPFFDHWRIAYGCRCEHADETVLFEGARYTAETQETLQQLVGGGARPRIFLLWENSD